MEESFAGSSSSVFYPQSCTHIAHSFNNKGELRTVLVTGGNRLVFLKEGAVIAEREIPSRPPSVAGPAETSATDDPLVQQLCVCPFLNYVVRVAVATREEVLLYECDDQDVVWQASDRVGAVASDDALFDPPRASPASAAGAASGHKGGPQGATSSMWAAMMHGSAAGGASASATPASAPTTGVRGRAEGPEGVYAGVPRRGAHVRCRRLQLPPAETELMPVTDHASSEAVAPAYSSASGAGVGRTVTVGGTASASGPARRRVLPTGQARVTMRTRRGAVVAAAFVADRSLCLVFDDEAVLVALGGGGRAGGTAHGPGATPTRTAPTFPSARSGPRPTAAAPDRILWRSMGAYRALAVCRVNRYVALALGPSTLVVFPSKRTRPATVAPAGVADLSGCASSLVSPLFSPTHHTLGAPVYPTLAPLALPRSDGGRPGAAAPASGPTLDDGTASTEGGEGGEDGDGVDEPVVLAEHGLTASLGSHRIQSMAWHRVSTHTLLCVTCAHPRDGQECVLLYTVQSLSSVRRFDNVLVPAEEKGTRWGGAGAEKRAYETPHRTHHGGRVQLVPAGTIPLAYAGVGRGVCHGGDGLAGPAHLAASVAHSPAATPTWQGARGDPLGVDEGVARERVGPPPPHSRRTSVPSTIWGQAKPPLVPEVLTGIVPGFSRSARTASLGNKLQLLHVEGDGTVRTSCYRFGRQRHASFAKQRGCGLRCGGLLAPLFTLYGPLTHMEVLPIWKHRPVELGPVTPQTKLFMTSTRRYRFVGRFGRAGLVAVVMVDLQAAVYKVDSFLTTGALPIRSLLAFRLPSMLGGEGERLVAALMGEHEEAETAVLTGAAGSDPGTAGVAPPSRPRAIPGCDCVALFTHFRVATGYTTLLLAVAPLPPPAVAGEGGGVGVGSAAPVPPPARATAGTPATLEERVQAFMAIKVPEKVRMFPALLKACNGDAGRLLTQLTAKYGALSSEEEALLPAESAPPTRITADGSAIAAAAVMATSSPTATATTGRAATTRSEGSAAKGAAAAAQYLLRGGCVTSDGVALHVSTGTQSSYTANAGAHPRPGAPPDYIIVIPPVALESLAPIHSRIAVGGVHVATAGFARVVEAPRGYRCVPPLSSAASRTASPASPGVVADPNRPESLSGVLLRAQHQFFRHSASEVMCEVVVATTAAAGRAAEPTEGHDVVEIVTYGPTLPATARDTVPRLRLEPEASPDVAGGGLARPAAAGYPRLLTVVDAKGQLLVNHDTVVGALVERQDTPGSAAYRELRLYGVPAVQSVDESELAWCLEHVVPDVLDFFLGPRGEVVVVQDGGRLLSRWLRCFPPPPSLAGSTPAARRYRYVQDTAWDGQTVRGDARPSRILAVESIPVTATGVAAASEAGHRRRLNAQPTTHFLFSTTAIDYMRVRLAPFASPDSAVAMVGVEQGGEDGPPPVAQYHPDSVMQLIGMARWRVLKDIFAGITSAAKTALVTQAESGEVAGGVRDPVALARRLCAREGGGSGGGGGRVGSGADAEDSAIVLCSPVPIRCEGLASLTAPVDLSMLPGCTETGAGTGPPGDPVGGTAVRLSEAFDDDVAMEELSALLPRVTLTGLSSRAQLGLLCIVQALHAASALGRSVDEAASRFFFFHKLNSLRRRLRLPELVEQTPSRAEVSASPAGCVEPSSILFFQVGKTAARNVASASFLWAAMSDSQSAILREVLQLSPQFGAQSGAMPSLVGPRVEWEVVEQAGIPYWLRTPEQLRVLAEAVGRTQFQATQSITECALMYCAARKPGTLAALCKTQNNTRLQAFFSRNFQEESHRNAAAANGYAAVSKNMPLYGAAFFLLAGDARSAAQVVLQRHGSTALALFVLRAGGAPGTAEEDLTWFQQLCAREDTASSSDGGGSGSGGGGGGAPLLGMWLQACLRWLVGGVPARLAALQGIGTHPTAHPEVLSVLRYARDCVAELSLRGESFLPPSRELTCLLRLGRYCLARGLQLSGELHYMDARHLLDRMLRDGGAHAGGGGGGGGAPGGSSQASLLPRPKMRADYNTGTLTFRGFDDDDDEVAGTVTPAAGGEGGYVAHGRQGAAILSQVDATATTHAGQAGGGGDAGLSGTPPSGIPPRVAAALQAEMSYVYHRRCRPHPPWLPEPPTVPPCAGERGDDGTVTSEGPPPDSAAPCVGVDGRAVPVTDAGVFAALCPLFLRVARQSPIDELEGSLARLLRYLVRPTGGTGPRWVPPSTSSAGTPPAPTDRKTAEVFVAALYVILGEVAVRGRHDALAHALYRVPLDVGVLLGGVQHLEGSHVHAVTALVLCVVHYLDEVTAAAGPASTTSRVPSAARRTRAAAKERGTSDWFGFDLGNARPPGLEDEDGEEGVGGGLPDPTAAGAEVAESTEEPTPRRRNIFEELQASYPAPGESPAASAVAPSRQAQAHELPLPTVAGQEGVGESAAHGGAGGLSILAGVEVGMGDEAVHAWYVAWFSAFVCTHTLQHLRRVAAEDTAPRSPTTQQAIDAGILDPDWADGSDVAVEEGPLSDGQGYRPAAHGGVGRFSAAHAFALRLLLCSVMAYATLRFNTLSEDCFHVLHEALPGYDRAQLTNPNGVFVEMDRTLRGVAEVLFAVLAAAAAEVVLASSTTTTVAHAAVASAGVCTRWDGLEGGGAPQTPPHESLTAHHRRQDSFLSSSLFHNPQQQQRRPRDQDAELLVQLCVSHAELFWQLPRIGRAAGGAGAGPTLDAGSSGTRGGDESGQGSRSMLAAAGGFFASTLSATYMGRMQRPHRGRPTGRTCSIRTVFDDPQMDPDSFTTVPGTSAGGEVLSLIESSWLRRHHTHRSLRDMLLRLATQGGLFDSPNGTNRILLTHASHSVQDVSYDCSNCDSLVWSTEAGTTVGHGYRELLAGDNEAPLQAQLAERNLATAAFSQGLSAQQLHTAVAGDSPTPPLPSPASASPAASHTTPTHAVSGSGVAASSAKALLSRRPVASVTAHGRPAPHPHLPFFLTCQPDGHLDLYPFASNGSVATFRCPRSHPTTRAAYSPNGYLFAVGLQDGSVAGWRFTAAAVESTPLFLLPSLFLPSGVKAVLFCGERSSLVVAVGIAREPHPPRAAFVTGRAGGPRRVAGAGGGEPSHSLFLPAGVSLGPRGGGSPALLSSTLSVSRRTSDGGGPDGAWQPPVKVGELLLIDTELNAGEVMVRCALPFLPEYAVYIPAMDAVLCVSASGLMAVYDLGLGRLTVISEVPLATLLSRGGVEGVGVSVEGSSLLSTGAGSTPASTSSPRLSRAPSHSVGAAEEVTVTAVAASPYDDLIALGTTDGFALLLTVEKISRSVRRVRAREEADGEHPYTYTAPTASTDARGAGGGRASSLPPSGSSGSQPSLAANESGAAFLAAHAADPAAVLVEATRVQVAPQLSAHACVLDVAFAPSVLLAGLRDGKVVAASLVPEVLRQYIISGAG